MSGKTKSLSTLVENQLPRFISDEYPMFVEFVKKYYEQLESQGQPLDIINNFVRYLDIDYYDKEVLKYYTSLSSSITTSSTTVNVVDTIGFPESNGYILIDDEVIFYKSKTQTSFVDCYRNVSATTKLGDLYHISDKKVVDYKDLGVGFTHATNARVLNVSNLFLYAFVKNFESQYLDSFPEESLKPEVNKKQLIKNIKQFYKSKGTDQSINFIFSSIISKEADDIPEVYYPKDFTIKSSGGEWVKTYSLKAKVISGNPYKLIGKRITQFLDPYDSSVKNAFAVVDSVSQLSDGYYEIIIAENSVVGEFKIASETFLTKTLDSTDGTGSFVNVYSTLGWNNFQGRIVVGSEEIFYEGKTINQFKILSRSTNPQTYPVTSTSSKIPVYSASTVAGTYVENGSTYTVKFLILGVLYNLLPDNASPYSTKGDLVEQLSPGFISRDPIIFDKVSGNVRWKINENFVYPASSQNTALTNMLNGVIANVSAVYEDSEYYYIASSSIPSHDIGLSSWISLKDQKQIRLIKKNPQRSTEIYKTPTRDIGILVNGVTVQGYKDYEDVVFGGVTEINLTRKGFGYKNPPYVLIEEKIGILTEASAIAYLSGESVDRIEITNPGSGYFPPNPTITITSGRNAVLRAVVTSGKVTSIVIINPGEYYSTAPEIRIVDKLGKGKFARYRAVVSSSGQIVECVLEDAGKFYTQDNIEIQVIPIGDGATATSEVRKWKKNRYYKLKNNLDSSNGFYFQNIDAEYGNGYSYVANPKKLRIDLNDNLSSTEQVPNTLVHSPILGYAYDGNPIYGPYGYSVAEDASSSIQRMTSSYVLKLNRLEGPGVDEYPLGSLIEDFQYIHRYGSLDENNGRFCVTPDYPDGTYAYFITIDSNNNPVFPYILGENYYSLPVDSNYTKLLTQDQIPKKSSRLRTAGIPANGLYSSAYIFDINNGEVSGIESQYSHNNFSVGCLVEAEYLENTGDGVIASVDSVEGKSVDFIQNHQTKALQIETTASCYFYDGELLKQSNSIYGTIVGNVFNSKTITLRNVQGTFNKNNPVYSDIKVINVIVDKSSSYTKDSIIKLKNGKSAIINSVNNSFLNVSSNPFQNGEPIVFTGSFSEIIANKQYYVRDSTIGIFKVSETLNGPAVSITNNSNIISTAVGQKASGIILEKVDDKNTVKIQIQTGQFDTSSSYYLESSTLTDTVGSKIFQLNKLSEDINIFALNDNIGLVKTSENHGLSIGDKVDIDINPNDSTTEFTYYVRRRIYQNCQLTTPEIDTKILDRGVGRLLVLNSGSYFNTSGQLSGDYASGGNQTYTNVELIFLDQTKCRDEYGIVVGTSTKAVIGKPGNSNNAKATINITNGVVTSVTITEKGSGYVVGDILTASNSSLGRPSNSLITQVFKAKVDHVGLSSTNTKLSLVSASGISNDDYLIIDKEIVKVSSVSLLTNSVTILRGQFNTSVTDHSNNTDVKGYNIKYRLSYPYVVGSQGNSAIIKTYDSLSNKLEVVYPIGTPMESISKLSIGYTFYDQSTPRKLITVKEIIESPTYKFEFSENTVEENYKKNPILNLQKYYLYKFDTSNSSLSGAFLEFSPSINYNILTTESIKSSSKPGSSGSYIKLKIGFGPSTALNTYSEKIDVSFSKFYYFDKSQITDSEKSYFDIIDDPLQGNKTVTYVTPNYFTYNISSIPLWDGSGTIKYTTTSTTAVGKINSLNISSGGKNLNKLPSIIGVYASPYTECTANVLWSSDTNNLLSVEIINNGSGYSKPKAIISYGDGTEADFDIKMGPNGSISGIYLKNPGKNYTFKPQIKIIETDVRCYFSSKNIGVPKSIKVSANGYGFYNDQTISNTYKTYDILVLKNTSENSFKIGEEIVQYESGIEVARGKIAPNGYSGKNNIIKIITLVGNFRKNLSITGQWNNNSCLVTDVLSSKLKSDITTYVNNVGKYLSEKSILGINTQKLLNSYYYQDYSYTIRSKTPISVWRDTINQTTHPAGFKVFGELTVQNPPVPSQIINVKPEIVSMVQLWDENTNHIRVLSENTRRQIITNIINVSEISVENGRGGVFAPLYDTGETISYEFVLDKPFDGSINESGNRIGTATFQMLLNGTTPLEVTNINNLFITLDGIFQEPGKSYTVSGSNITFTEPPFGWRDQNGDWPSDSYVGLGEAWRTYSNPNYTPPQKFVGRFIKFKDSTLNSQYFKKVKNISSQFDGEKTSFDLYYEDNTPVVLSSFENLLVSMDGIIQQNGITPVFPGDRAYYIKRTVTPNQIVFIEPPKIYELQKQSFYAYNVGAYERLEIDTRYIDDNRTGPFTIRSPLTNKTVSVDEDRNVMVFVDGVLQKRIKSYRISGSSITFTDPVRKNQKINILYLYGRDYVKSLVAFDFEQSQFVNYFKIGVSLPVGGINLTQFENIAYQGNSIYDNTAIATLRYINRVTDVPGINYYLYFETVQNKTFSTSSQIKFVNPKTYQEITSASISSQYIVSIEPFAENGDTQELLKKSSKTFRDFIKVGDEVKIDGEGDYRKVISIPSDAIKTEYRTTNEVNSGYFTKLGVTGYNGESMGEGLDVTAVVDTNSSSSTYGQVISLNWNRKNWEEYYTNNILPIGAGYGYDSYPILKFVPQPGRDDDGNIISNQPAQGGGAEGYAITNGNEIIDVVLTNRGGGYLAPPKVYVTRQYKVRRNVAYENIYNLNVESPSVSSSSLVVASSESVGVWPGTESFVNVEQILVSPSVGFQNIETIQTSSSGSITNNTDVNRVTVVSPAVQEILCLTNTGNIISQFELEDDRNAGYTTTDSAVTVPLLSGIFDKNTTSTTIPSRFDQGILGNRWALVNDVLDADTGVIKVSGIQISEFTARYPGLTINTLNTSNLESVLLNSYTIPWDYGYASINNVMSKVQTSSVPGELDLGYSATGAIIYAQTTGFPSSGYFQLNKELISYTSKLSDRFLGCTRGISNTTISSHQIGDYLISASAPV